MSNRWKDHEEADKYARIAPYAERAIRKRAASLHNELTNLQFALSRETARDMIEDCPVEMEIGGYLVRPTTEQRKAFFVRDRITGTESRVYIDNVLALIPEGETE